MATILLNESDPVRHELLRLRLQRQGHNVWSAQHLNDIIATLHDVAVDVMILDLDYQNLDELSAFANRWKGIRILFQASSTVLLQDFRCWMADQFIFKRQLHHLATATITCATAWAAYSPTTSVIWLTAPPGFIIFTKTSA